MGLRASRVCALLVGVTLSISMREHQLSLSAAPKGLSAAAGRRVPEAQRCAAPRSRCALSFRDRRIAQVTLRLALTLRGGGSSDSNHFDEDREHSRVAEGATSSSIDPEGGEIEADKSSRDGSAVSDAERLRENEDQGARPFRDNEEGDNEGEEGNDAGLGGRTGGSGASLELWEGSPGVNETDVAVLGQRLIDAARLGRVEAARTLVAMGADLNVRSTEQKREGWAPIFFAATAGRTATAALLVRLGADPNARDRFNATALHYAADRGKVALRHTCFSRTACRVSRSAAPGDWLRPGAERRGGAAGGHLLCPDRARGGRGRAHVARPHDPDALRGAGLQAVLRAANHSAGPVAAAGCLGRRHADSAGGGGAQAMRGWKNACLRLSVMGGSSPPPPPAPVRFPQRLALRCAACKILLVRSLQDPLAGC